MITKPVLTDEEVEKRVISFGRQYPVVQEVFRGCSDENPSRRIYYLTTERCNFPLMSKITDLEIILTKRGRRDIDILQWPADNFQDFMGERIYSKA